MWLGGAVFLIWLLLGRKLITAGEHEDTCAALRKTHADALAARDAAHASRLAEVVARVEQLDSRVQALVVDRDAWREAHHEETLARQASEKAAAALMETGQISLALLSALKDALGGRPDPG